jgi:opacity protein-like surface antigen
MKRCAVACLSAVLGLVGSRSAVAQPVQGLSIRPFFVASIQQFTAQDTFEAAFGRTSEAFFGGGLNITQDDSAYLELTASRFKKTGEQAFYNNGEAFRLGIPMTATITPFELTAGYRFHRRQRRLPSSNRPAVVPSRFIPYVGGGFGLYRYEQSSAFATDEEDVDTRHVGAILEGGVEIRVQKWVGIGADLHYTYVPGILGEAGISQLADENDLGGIAFRVKVVIGR